MFVSLFVQIRVYNSYAHRLTDLLSSPMRIVSVLSSRPCFLAVFFLRKLLINHPKGVACFELLQVSLIRNVDRWRIAYLCSCSCSLTILMQVFSKKNGYLMRVIQKTVAKVRDKNNRPSQPENEENDENEDENSEMVPSYVLTIRRRKREWKKRSLKSR